MWTLDTSAVLKWLASIGAKLLLLAFISPFVIMLTASAYAVVASQLGSIVGVVAAGMTVVIVGLVLNHWLWIIKRQKS